jgi:FAD/FMN-containing dehydrogenase
MSDLHFTTISGADTVVQEDIVNAFKATFRGDTLFPGDESYEEARKVWNGMINKRPALIARCTGVADVISAVNFARTQHLLVSVRGGGHNIPGNCVCDGGVVIDLSRMKGIRVDPGNRTVRAEGGVKWGELDRETQTFGLAVPGGTDADTGIAGLTLGGGIGWLSGKYGLACDNLISADVVTADGQFLTVSSNSDHADLFWALRGGGGNYGIVTSFEYQLHPVGPTVLAGLVFYPFEKAAEFLRFYGDFSSDIPDELNTIAGLGTSPDGAPVGVLAVCYSGAIEEGERVLQPIREFGPPVVDHIEPMPYTLAQQMLAPLAPSGRQYYIKSHFMKTISTDAIDVMVTHFSQVTSPLTAMIFQQLGNAANRVDVRETAFGHRDAGYEWAALSAWIDPEESERHIGWTRAFSDAMLPYTNGFYVNQMGTESEEGEAQLQSAYGANYDRLAALKNAYDSTNFFSHNQNIRPRG